MQPGAALTPGVRQVRNGASIALVVLHLDRPLLNGQVSLCLPGRAARRGPPYGGVTSHGRLRGALLRARRSTGLPNQSPGGSRPSQLVVNTLQEDEEALRGKSLLGVLGVELPPPGLRCLDAGGRRRP